MHERQHLKVDGNNLKRLRSYEQPADVPVSKMDEGGTLSTPVTQWRSRAEDDWTPDGSRP